MLLLYSIVVIFNMIEYLVECQICLHEMNGPSSYISTLTLSYYPILHAQRCVQLLACCVGTRGKLSYITRLTMCSTTGLLCGNPW